MLSTVAGVISVEGSDQLNETSRLPDLANRHFRLAHVLITLSHKIFVPYVERILHFSPHIALRRFQLGKGWGKLRIFMSFRKWTA